MASMVKVYRDYGDKVLFDEDMYMPHKKYMFKVKDNENFNHVDDVNSSPRRDTNDSFESDNNYGESDMASINIFYGDESKSSITEEEDIQHLCTQSGYYNTRKYSKINPDGVFRCQKCSQTFSYSIYYQYHIENSRCSGKRYNRCYFQMMSNDRQKNNETVDITPEKQCSDSNNNKNNEIEKQVEIKNLKPSYEFKDQNDLVHSKPFKCSMCTSRFSTSHNLKVHLRTHTNEKPYQCTVCSARFKSSGSLTIHKRIHTGEKPYKCSICSAGFAQMTNLDRHIRTHTKERPYKCPVCPSGFISSSDLKRHIRIHTNEKPYKCNLCTASFRTSGNLKIHLRTHTNEKPYVCSLCSKSFATSSNFKTHMRRHEEENGDDTPIICVKV